MSIVECASPVYQAGTQTLVVACGECKPCLRAKLAAAEKNLSMALTEVERNTKDTEDLHKRLADAEERDKLWREYAALLGREIDSLIGIAHAHGWASSDANIAAGKQLRKALGL